MIAMAWTASSVVWLMLVLVAWRSSWRGRWPQVLMALWLVMIVATLFTDDVLSGDAYRYRWDGWVQIHGIDPYAHAPNSPVLLPLHTSDGNHAYPDELAYADLPTLYPPGAQLVFFGTAKLVGVSPLGWKLVWHILTIAIFLIADWWLKQDAAARTRLWLVATCPLLFFNAYADQHLDMLAGGLMLLGFLAAERKAARTAGALLGLGIAIKLLPVVGLVVLLVNKRTHKRGTIAIAAAVVLALTIAPYITSAMQGHWSTFMTKFSSNALLYSMAADMLGNDVARRVLMLVGLAFAAFVWYRWRENSALAACGMLLAIYLCSPMVHAWYLVTPLLLWVVAPNRATAVWSATMCAYGLIVVAYRATGHWHEARTLLMLEYVPVLLAFGIDLWRKNPARPIDFAPMP